MIAKIVTGASFGGCTAYAYGKDLAEVIAHDGIIPDDPKIAAKCFEIQSQLNPRVSKPVGHIAISFKPEDKPRLTNEFMMQVAKEYMEKMGIKDTQYVIVRHHNTPNPHCHLIFNRVDNNGKRISDSNWLKRNVRVCKELNEQIEKMKEIAKRPPLFSLHLNLTAKVFAIIMAVLLILGAAGYVWFINTPMYLGHELYISYVNRRHPSPGQGFHKAYQATLSGNRKGVKALIRSSNYWEKDYKTYADTLRNILSDSTIFINGIQYDQYERLVDYTDSTGIIKSAHFRKGGSVRITDDQRMITLEDARNTKIIWKRVR